MAARRSKTWCKAESARVAAAIWARWQGVACPASVESNDRLRRSAKVCAPGRNCDPCSEVWWRPNNPESRFYGFDTFEGLPESWGTYAKGDMRANFFNVDDSRSEFVKGLFQDTLFGFMNSHLFGTRKMILHLDADLFSSTLFVLTTLARVLKKGDIIIFDEFNVPNHEYFAFKIFTESFYVKYELIGAVNNYYQTAFRII